jgi:hypothetical protein
VGNFSSDKRVTFDYKTEVIQAKQIQPCTSSIYRTSYMEGCFENCWVRPFSANNVVNVAEVNYLLLLNEHANMLKYKRMNFIKIIKM